MEYGKTKLGLHVFVNQAKQAGHSSCLQYNGAGDRRAGKPTDTTCKLGEIVHCRIGIKHKRSEPDPCEPCSSCQTLLPHRFSFFIHERAGSETETAVECAREPCNCTTLIEIQSLLPSFKEV